jgi:hypothetical protein
VRSGIQTTSNRVLIAGGTYIAFLATCPITVGRPTRNNAAGEACRDCSPKPPTHGTTHHVWVTGLPRLESRGGRSRHHGPALRHRIDVRWNLATEQNRTTTRTDKGISLDGAADLIDAPPAHRLQCLGAGTQKRRFRAGFQHDLHPGTRSRPKSPAVSFCAGVFKRAGSGEVLVILCSTYSTGGCASTHPLPAFSYPGYGDQR